MIFFYIFIQLHFILGISRNLYSNLLLGTFRKQHLESHEKTVLLYIVLVFDERLVCASSEADYLSQTLALVNVEGNLNASLVPEEKKPKTSVKYAFYRTMAQKREDQVESRRVFGGAVASLNEFPAVAALLDRYWITKCSASVIKPYWALTAAHCVTSHVAYVRYNTGNPSSSAGNTAHALYLYRHPNFKVKQEDEGEGMDITVLHHDLGLIRTRDRMILRTPMSPLKSMGQYKPDELRRYEVTVLGYGKTNDAQKAGENLYAVKLRMDSCYRDSWLHCFCGNAIGQEQRGVCSGDSGGPVVYKRVQVGVTSMGPVECVSIRSDLPEEASSVFTSTYHYQNLIQRTINNAEKEIEIKRARMSGDDSKTASESISLVIISVLAIVLL